MSDIINKLICHNLMFCLLFAVFFYQKTAADEVPLYIILVEESRSGNKVIKGVYCTNNFQPVSRIKLTLCRGGGRSAKSTFTSPRKDEIFVKPYLLDFVSCKSVTSFSFQEVMQVQIACVLVKGDSVELQTGRHVKCLPPDEYSYFAESFRGRSVPAVLYVDRKDELPFLLPVYDFSGKWSSPEFRRCDEKYVSYKNFFTLQVNNVAIAYIDLPGRCLAYSHVEDKSAGATPVLAFVRDQKFYRWPKASNVGDSIGKVTLKELSTPVSLGLKPFLRPVFDVLVDNAAEGPFLFDVHLPDGFDTQNKKIELYDLGPQAKKHQYVTSAYWKDGKSTRTFHRNKFVYSPLLYNIPADIYYKLKIEGRDDCDSCFFKFKESLKNDDLTPSQIWSERAPEFIVFCDGCQRELAQDEDDREHLDREEVPKPCKEWQERLPSSWTGGYTVTSKPIEAGAQSHICRAVCNSTGLVYALRYDKPGISRQEADVKQEIAILEKLVGVRHDNLVRVYEVFQIPGENRVAVRMEFCRENLIDMVKRKTRLSPAEVVPIMKQVILGGQCLHQMQIVHHDLKPENLMFGRDEKLKIIDFGLAEEIDSTGKSKRVIGCLAVYGFTADQFGVSVGTLLSSLQRAGYAAYVSEYVTYQSLLFYLRLGTTPLGNSGFLKKIGASSDKTPCDNPQQLALKLQAILFKWLHSSVPEKTPEESRRYRLEEMYDFFGLVKDPKELDFSVYLLSLNSGVCGKNFDDVLLQHDYFK
ncbi:protein kinase domain-containing protein [Endozoicomonadaceae bacterium StTr2]